MLQQCRAIIIPYEESLKTTSDWNSCAYRFLSNDSFTSDDLYIFLFHFTFFFFLENFLNLIVASSWTTIVRGGCFYTWINIRSFSSDDLYIYFFFLENFLNLTVALSWTTIVRGGCFYYFFITAFIIFLYLYTWINIHSFTSDDLYISFFFFKFFKFNSRLELNNDCSRWLLLYLD